MVGAKEKSLLRQRAETQQNYSPASALGGLGGIQGINPEQATPAANGAPAGNAAGELPSLPPGGLTPKAATPAPAPAKAK